MPFEMFESHLRDPAPGFRCHSAGDRSEEIKHVAKLTNRIRAPASSAALAAAKSKIVGASDSLERFMSLHNGVALYVDTNSDSSGFEFFPCEEWEARTAEMRESMTAMGFDENEMPGWFHHGIAFGEIPQSGNYFVLQTEGKEKDCVFYADHDDFTTEAFALSFDQFLEQIATDPPGFLYRCGCYARYSDGKTETQWIPKEYLRDCDSR